MPSTKKRGKKKKSVAFAPTNRKERTAAFSRKGGEGRSAFTFWS